MKLLSETKTLTAAACNAQMELPLQSLVREIIDAATDHANALGFGYDRLLADGNAWVLSRLCVEMQRFPAVGDTYTLTTWIEATNRHFSTRNFEITDSNGTTLGHSRTVWAGIDIKTRRSVDLTGLQSLVDMSLDRQCPVAPPARLRFASRNPIVTPYTVQVSDIDSNRHLTTARYVELAVNCLSLDDYDRCFPGRFDISFMKECRFGEALDISHSLDGSTLDVAIANSAGETCCDARIILTER